MQDAAPAQLSSMPQGAAQYVLSSAQNAQQRPDAPQPETPTIDPRLAKAGLGWHALMGTHGEVGPNGTVVQQQNTAGQLFRSILSGAIMGMASGAQAKMGGGIGSFAVGAGAAQQQQEQQRDKLQAESQQQFQNQQAQEREKRAQAAASSEETLRKAQIALSNVETLRMNQTMQGESFELHQKMADAGKAQIQSYVDAGMTPVAKDIPESEQTQYIADHPGSTTLDWELTGTKLTVGPDGKPAYEGVYTAYDPKGKVNVSTATYDQWKKDGVFDRFPEYGAVLKDNKQLTASQFVSIKRDADKVRADNLTRQLQDLGVKKVQVEIDKDNAEKAKYLADASRIRQEAKDAALGRTQAEQFNNALKELNDKGGNFDAISPGSRVIIAESMNKMVPALNQQYKTLIDDTMNPNSQAEAGEVLRQIQNLTSLGQRALTTIGKTPGANPNQGVLAILQNIPGFDPQTAQKIASLSPDEIVAQLQSSKLSEDVKNKILTSIGRTPAAPKPFFDSVPKGSVGEKILNVQPTPFNPGNML
jgi:hypothetical protein